MLEQVGNAITFYAQFLDGGAGATGLTVTCSVWKGRAGSVVVSAQSATEIGGGLYKYTLAAGSVDVEEDYVADFNTVGTADQADVASMWAVGRAGVENLSDPLLNTVPGPYAQGTAGYALGRIGTGHVTVVQPVSGDHPPLLALVRGDDYHTDDGRAISFSSEAWPNLTGATEVRITMRRRPQAFNGLGSDDLLLSVTDDATGRQFGGAMQVVRFNLAAANTIYLLPGVNTGKYDVQATVDGNVLTLVTGLINTIEDQTR